MDIRLNDIITMKKSHPCGGKQWKVLRVGMDFALDALHAGVKSCVLGK